LILERYYIYLFVFLTAVGFTPGSRSTVHTNSTQNTESGTYIAIKTKKRIAVNRKKFGKCGPYLVFGSYTLEFVLQMRKKHGKPSVWVEKLQLLESRLYDNLHLVKGKW
jgi:hypothetical protein